MKKEFLMFIASLAFFSLSILSKSCLAQVSRHGSKSSTTWFAFDERTCVDPVAAQHATGYKIVRVEISCKKCSNQVEKLKNHQVFWSSEKTGE